MRYSYDLRIRVVKFVQNGGTKTEASRVFGVSRKTIYHWMKKGKDLAHFSKPGPRKPFKVDMKKLEKDMEVHPDEMHRERAVRFGVHESTICKRVKDLSISRKKNDAIQRNMLVFEKKIP